MNDNFLTVAKQAVMEAGLIVSKHFGKKNTIQSKNNDISNLVTEVDFKSEKTIMGIISKNFPTHNIITEESNSTHKGSEYTWVIDPLDGTMSFVHGMPHFCVAVGLMKNNQPIVGAIYNVLNKDLYYAQKGQGAYLNGKKIRVSKIDSLDRSAVVFGWGSMKIRPEKFKKYIEPLMNKVHYPYSVGSGTTGHVFLSKGIVEATFDIGWIWDFAASFVIVSEAGGKMTDFEGREIDWNKDRNDRLEAMASNGLIHNQILEALK